MFLNRPFQTDNAIGYTGRYSRCRRRGGLKIRIRPSAESRLSGRQRASDIQGASQKKYIFLKIFMDNIGAMC